MDALKLMPNVMIGFLKIMKGSGVRDGKNKPV